MSDPISRDGTGRAATRHDLLPLLCALSFALSLNSGVLNPLLPEISRDLGVSITAAGQLATVSLVTCALAALVAGTLSDLYGRRVFLAGGLALVGAGALGTSLSPTYAAALLGRALGGLGFVMAVALALAGDAFRGAERDQAAARLLVADASAYLVGVPLVAATAQLAGWRLANAGFGVLCLVLALLAWTGLPHQPRPVETPGLRAAFAALWHEHRRRPELLLVLLANGLRNTFWVGFTTYAGAFYAAIFGFQTWQLGPLLALGAAFYIAGTEAGGRLVGRLGPARLTAAGCGGAALLATALPLVAVLPLSLATLAALCLLGGAANSALMAWLLRLAPARRGGTLALSNALTNLGAAVGAACGGVGIMVMGYSGLGLAVAGFALAAAACALWSARYQTKVAEA